MSVIDAMAGLGGQEKNLGLGNIPNNITHSAKKSKMLISFSNLQSRASCVRKISVSI